MAEAKLKSDVKLDLVVILELSIDEAIALNEITKYGHKAFLEGYYKQLGKSYLQPYENGVKSLFDTIDKSLPNAISKSNEIIKSVNKIFE